MINAPLRVHGGLHDAMSGAALIISRCRSCPAAKSRISASRRLFELAAIILESSQDALEDARIVCLRVILTPLAELEGFTVPFWDKNPFLGQDPVLLAG